METDTTDSLIDNLISEKQKEILLLEHFSNILRNIRKVGFATTL